MAKMYRKLAILTLVTSFGGGSSKPAKKAKNMILASCLAAVVCGNMLSKSLSQLNMATDIPLKIIFTLTAVLIFVILSFVMLPLSQKVDSKQSIGAKNLQILPLSKLARWLVVITPLIAICTVVSLFFMPLLVSFASQLHTSLGVLILAYILGLTSAVGLALYNFMPLTAKLFGFISLSALQFYMLDLIVKSSSRKSASLLILAVTASLIFCSAGLVYRFFVVSVKNHCNQSRLNKFKLPKVSLISQWYLLKVIRNKKTLTSLLFCFIIVTAIVGFATVRHQSISPESLYVLTSVLAVSLACEFRGISRQFKTPEILILKNVGFFVNSQIKSCVSAVMFVAIPATFYLAKFNSSASGTAWLYFLSILFAASLVGLLSGTIFVPESGQLGAQFFSATFGVALLLIVPKIFNFNRLDINLQSVAWLILSGICCLGMMLIEENRIKNYGRI